MPLESTVRRWRRPNYRFIEPNKKCLLENCEVISKVYLLQMEHNSVLFLNVFPVKNGETDLELYLEIILEFYL